MKITQTKRLYLREFQLTDASNLYLLNADPDVIRFTGDPAFKDIEDAKSFIANYKDYKEHKVGRWAVINTETDEFLGWCGLKYTPKTNEYDIGFRFFQKYWNKGYATESSLACLQLGFKKFNLSKIVGRAMKDNIGSIKVLEKIGLTYEGKIKLSGKEGSLYSITNARNHS